MASSMFLELPQELRDHIFDYAIYGRDNVSRDEIAFLDRRTERLPYASDECDWKVNYQTQVPISPHLSSMLCNRQLNREMKDFMQRTQTSERLLTSITLHLAPCSVTPRLTHLAGHPKDISTLDLLIKVDQMYHPAYASNRSPLNAIFAAVFDVLKRYIYSGPHLSRSSPLSHISSLDKVNITLAPPVAFADLAYFYGNPAQQLEELCRPLSSFLSRFARSGLPYGSIGEFWLGVEDSAKVERILVTSNIWDENDFVFMRNLGFEWGGEDDLEPNVSMID